MREHVRQLVQDAKRNDQPSLGAEAVRLARIAAAMHIAQQQPAPTATSTRAHSATLQEQWQ